MSRQTTYRIENVKIGPHETLSVSFRRVGGVSSRGRAGQGGMAARRGCIPPAFVPRAMRPGELVDFPRADGDLAVRAAMPPEVTGVGGWL